MTAAEEDRIRRKKALEQEAKVRAIYEEMVLKKPQPAVVQIGSVSAIKSATNGDNGSLVSIGKGNGNSNGHADPEAPAKIGETNQESPVVQ